MATIVPYLERAVKEGASDLFVVAGGVISCKKNGHLSPMSEEKLTPDMTQELITGLYCVANRKRELYDRVGDDDFSFAIDGLARFRVNAYRQRGSLAAVIRVVAFEIPSCEEMNIPEEVMRIAEQQHGMVLFSGTAGSGKSTTQACIIDKMNHTRDGHIITLEDPIEYLHRNNTCLISQREIAIDTDNYLSALRACLRQAPDVIQLGEMRDFETICTAVTAAETGHLLLATLHTKGAVNTIDRIIDTFPSDQQAQIRIQLSMVLNTVVSQQLVPGAKGGMVPAFEVMNMNSAIRNMIRDSKNYQIENVIQTSAAEGMISMDQSLLRLYQTGKITAETAVEYATNPEQVKRKL
ncbi:MAG: PilT/PilU family type 4a pilus ATPase [Lachnospiraceae bacterium]|nr:PilT/PilU family type 4a pilus ATPase [Lachnospiraceae bacterium]